MSYVRDLLKGNKPTQTSDYGKMLQDLETVSTTAGKQWGARGEPTKVSSYADRTRGQRETGAADLQRRLANQGRTAEIAAQGDQRRTGMSLGIEAAMADREQRGAERTEEARQTWKGHQQDLREVQQGTEQDWRKIAFDDYKSKMTSLDRLTITMNDANFKELEMAERIQHGFSLQEIQNNFKYEKHLLEEAFKKWKQDRTFSFEDLVRKMESSANNISNIIGGITEIAGTILTSGGEGSGE